MRLSKPASTQRLLLPGDLIGGRYRVQALLGQGGMGIVAAATDVVVGQRVAVKVMLPGMIGNAKLVARFQREGKAAAALRSEHAVRVMDMGADEGGSLYLVMELLEGENLKTLVKKRGRLPIEEAVGYMLQACDAIAEAHVLGIIHRDLKPSNLFLVGRPDGTRSVKVLDFGISKATKLNAPELESQGLTATDVALGSPRFASPEQLRDAKRADARSDIWSLGVVLHWVLTGDYPFEAPSFGAHLVKLVNEPPTALRDRLPSAPAALEAAVLRCLEKPAAQRFQSVGELALALAPFAPRAAELVLPSVLARLGIPTPLDDAEPGPRRGP